MMRQPRRRAGGLSPGGLVGLLLLVVVGTAPPALGQGTAPPPATAQTPATPSPAPAPVPEYVLGPGDVLEIQVIGQPELTRVVIVRSDGRITVPLLGEMLVAGVTPAQVAALITAGLRTFIKNPVVTVAVAKERVEPRLVYVLGAGISKPGTVEMEKGWTVIEAIAAAGGVTPRAALKRATLIRRGSTPIPLDLERLLVQGDTAANQMLQPGDVLMIPVMQNRVLVLGVVNNPGVYDLDDGARLMDALASAGGTADRPGLESVAVIRASADGKPNAQTFNVTRVLAKGDQTQNPVLRHGDIVYVPQSRKITLQQILEWISGINLFKALLGLP